MHNEVSLFERAQQHEKREKSRDRRAAHRLSALPECRWDRVCMRRFYLPAIPLPSIFPSADLAAASTIQMSNFLSIPRYLSPQSIVMCRRQHIVAEVALLPSREDADEWADPLRSVSLS